MAALFAALSAFGAARSGRAEDPRGDARAHYAKGLELAGENGYEGALREFNEAYTISPQYAVLYNIGQAHIALGHAAEAIETLGRYLADGGDRISPARRAQVERQIALLHTERPSPTPTSETEASAAGDGSAAATGVSQAPPPRLGTLTVRCSDPMLRLTLDGKHLDLAASTRGLPVPAGPHRLGLSIPGRRSAEQNLTIPEGTATVVICEDLVPSFVPAGPQPVAVGPPVFSEITANAATPTIHARTVGYLLGGLGLAISGSAIGLFVWNHGQAQNAQAEYRNLPAGGTNDPLFHDRAVQYSQDADSVRRDNIFAIGLGVAGAGLVAGSVYLLWREHRHPAKTEQADATRGWAMLAPGGALLAGVW
jgi:tetratricopeptide (TPR) repeat protein